MQAGLYFSSEGFQNDPEMLWKFIQKKYKNNIEATFLTSTLYILIQGHWNRFLTEKTFT